MPSTLLPGPIGVIEADVSPGRSDAWAIICHPHPLYGGSMDDAVVGVVRARFAAAGWGTALFNFRGVGGSAGRHDGGQGEVADALAVADWLLAGHEVGKLVLVGYSFGSSVAWRCLPELTRAQGAVLIAPPIGSMPYPHNPSAFGAVIAGDEDRFIDAAQLEEWLAAHGGIQRFGIAGGDHFLAARVDELAAAIDGAIARVVTNP